MQAIIIQSEYIISKQKEFIDMMQQYEMTEKSRDFSRCIQILHDLQDKTALALLELNDIDIDREANHLQDGMFMLSYIDAENELTRIASWIMDSGFELFTSPKPKEDKHLASNVGHLRTSQAYLRNEVDKLIGFLEGNKHFIQTIKITVSNKDRLNDFVKLTEECCDILNRFAIWIPDYAVPKVIDPRTQQHRRNKKIASILSRIYKYYKKIPQRQ